MKPINIIISIVCIVLCLFGWVSVVSDSVSQKDTYEQTLALAESYMEEGLYQRAINEYMTLFDERKELEIAERILIAYDLRFIETVEETYESFVDDMEKIVDVFPSNSKFAIKLANLYLYEENNKKAFGCLQNAKENGAEGEALESLLRKTRYAYTLSYNEYNSALPTTGTTYVVNKDNLWGIYDVKAGTRFKCKYEYVSQVGKDGVVVITNEDSRLINGENMVMGIFEEIIVDAGAYSEGLIPASTDGEKYSYYDEFAKKVFGEFEVAGTFVDGKAAVKKDGKWCFVNTSGEVVGESYDDVVLNYLGEYISGSFMLASTKKGEYVFYNEKMESVAKISGCEKIGALTEDGIVAFCKDGKWGYVNTSGEVVIEPAYDDARSFSNGLAAVYKDGKWGFIDKDNSVIIDFAFFDVGYFNSEGTTMVCTKVTDVKVPDSDENEDVSDEQPETSTENDESNAGDDETDVADESTTEEEPNEEEQETVQVETWVILKLVNGIVKD